MSSPPVQAGEGIGGTEGTRSPPPPQGDGGDEKARPHTLKIGSYIIGETLGKGSFGKVKMAVHETSKHKVAVKILNRQKIKTSHMNKKIRREIKVLKLFHHPHIIRLYDVFETSSDIFMVMEFVSGGELFDYIVQKGKLQEAEARRFFQQIISGVEYFHHFGVVHRDLKPENLLLDHQLNVKIADFGLSNLRKDGEFLRTSCGSPNYAAPEVISGKLYAGEEVDVWSCGVILYALLCGRLPFDEETIPMLFNVIRAGKYSIPSAVPPGAKELIEKILVVDPVKRITLKEVRKSEWFQTDLPAYLSVPLKDIPKEGSVPIDPKIVQQLTAKWDVAPEVIMASLKTGDISDERGCDIRLAYNIIADTLRRKEIEQENKGSGAPPSAGTTPTTRTPSQFLSAFPGQQLASSPVMESLVQYGSQEGLRQKYNNSKFVSPSALPTYSDPNRPCAGLSLSCSPPFRSYIQGGAARSAPDARTIGFHHLTALESPPVGSSRSILSSPNSNNPPPTADSSLSAMERAFMEHHGIGWRLGMLTEHKSMHVMNVIYKMLEDRNYVWKVMAPFHLRVRPKESTGGDLVIDIRIYRMHERHDKGFIVDFAHMDGPVMPGLDTISSLYEECRQQLG